MYAPLLGRWCLSGDEFYTWEDSAKYSIAEMLGFNSRPLYFIVCHYLLRWIPNLPVELVIRIPAMLAASFVAPSLYGLLGSRRFGKMGLFAALIALLNPWLFQMSQFGRYYAFVVFFASLTTIAALRFMEERQRRVWLILFFVSGLLAAVSHPPAVLIIPAGIAALILARFREDPETVMGLVKKYGVYVVGSLVVFAGIGLFLLRNLIREWLAAKSGGFGGSYDVASILMAIGVFGGLSFWSLAVIPLLRFPTSWSAQDIFFITLLVGSVGPLMMLVPFGGGVAARYFMFCLPCMFLMAAQHWQQIDARLPSMGYRLAFASALFAFNVPYLVSVAKDGNHFDHRSIARAIEELDLENPLIFATGRRLVRYYLDDRLAVESEIADELGEFRVGVPRKKLSRAIARARSEQRPLLVVSRQDRAMLSVEDQKWLYERFAVLRTVETARYDHRRYRVILYQYRPMQKRKTSAAVVTP